MLGFVIPRKMRNTTTYVSLDDARGRSITADASDRSKSGVRRNRTRRSALPSGRHLGHTPIEPGIKPLESLNLPQVPTLAMACTLNVPFHRC